MQPIVRESELWKNSFVLASRKAFFYRFADTGFKDKWCGFWRGAKKFVEYFAVASNGEWLGEQNCKRFAFDGAKAVFDFETADGRVKQTVVVPKNSSALQVLLEGEKDLRMQLELAVNIREREENLHERAYWLRKEKGCLVVASEKGKIAFVPHQGKRCIIGLHGYYKGHSPGGEAQHCFVLPKIFLEGKRIAFEIQALEEGEKPKKLKRVEESIAEKELEIEEEMHDVVKSDCRELENGFRWSLWGLKALETDSAFFAGYPWFLQYWGRDLLWSLHGLLCIGEFEKARKILSLLARRARRGEIPNRLELGGERNFVGIDATPLWIIGLADYFVASDDINFLERMRRPLALALHFLFRRDIDANGFIEHDLEGNETWMDSLNRKENAIEVQALLAEAMKRSLPLLQELGLTKEACYTKKRLERTMDCFEKQFFCNSFFADSLYKGKRIEVQTSNCLVPIMLRQFSEKNSLKALQRIEGPGFCCKKGIRTRAKGEEDFAAGGYHNGSAWSLTTAWAAMAEFALGRKENGWMFLEKLFGDLQEDCLGGIGECWNSETGALIGCGMQLWAHGLAIRIVDEFLLGMRVDAANRKIFLKPQLPAGINFVERKKRVGKSWALVTVKRKGKKVMAKSSNKKIRVFLEKG